MFIAAAFLSCLPRGVNSKLELGSSREVYRTLLAAEGGTRDKREAKKSILAKTQGHPGFQTGLPRQY
jgi:hypothetical protein